MCSQPQMGFFHRCVSELLRHQKSSNLVMRPRRQINNIRHHMLHPVRTNSNYKEVFRKPCSSLSCNELHLYISRERERQRNTPRFSFFLLHPSWHQRFTCLSEKGLASWPKCFSKGTCNCAFDVQLSATLRQSSTETSTEV